MKKGLSAMVTSAVVLSGCAASVDLQQIKLDSGRVYEVAKTRSGVEFLDCGTQLVSYLFDERGSLVDAKSERGVALHCGVIQAWIEAGGRVGAAAVASQAVTKVTNSVSSAVGNTVSNSNQQGQGQIQGQQQGQHQGQSGHSGGEGGGHGNNGGGNGAGDGTNPGTGHHHDNGDSD